MITLLSFILKLDATESAAKTRLLEKLNLCLQRVEELTSLLHGTVISSHRKPELVTSNSISISPFEELCKLGFFLR